MSHMLNCIVSLAYWDYSTENQGSRTLFRVLGVMAHIPGCLAMLGRPTRLMSEHGPHS
jgi:hypothetical protein